MPTLALIGCAHIHTPGFVSVIKKRPEMKVKYVWDPNPARSQRWATELGAKVIKSPAKAMKDEEVAGVVICSETGLHKKLVTAAAKAKKAIFAEKPLGFGAKDSYAMADAVEAAGVAFQTGYFNRGNPMHLFIKRQIEAGNFGKITRVRGSNVHSGALGGWFDSKPNEPATDWRWMADPKLAGCGAFGDLGTHFLDIMMWLMGDVESATADIKVVTGRYGECDESGEGLMRFKNGATGTLAGGWVDVGNPVSLLVSGTEGHAVIVNDKLYFRSSKVEGSSNREPWTQLPEAAPAGFPAFLDHLEGKPVQLVSVREAAQRVAVMEAMYKGSAKRKWVPVA